MKLNNLKAGDLKLFNKFLGLRNHNLSNYSFANILIWKDLFKIDWTIIEDNLCIFFKDSCGTFMYLPPLGQRQSPALIEELFKIMDRLNENKQFSRIDNVEGQGLSLFYQLGYKISFKSSEYVYQREKIACLKGNCFKSKRWGYNYFVNHYKFSSLPLNPHRDRRMCLGLCRNWVAQRKKNNSDNLYGYMLEDSFNCQRISFDYYKHLSLLGKTVRVDGKIKAYTFGFKLNKDVFCISFEVADRNIKGISQFIFKYFSSQLNNYKYINIMDDSGLDNLKKVKLSYRPDKLIPNYTIQRNDFSGFR